MAPHTEKSQFISKPAARRGGSKSPSKTKTENAEMAQQTQELVTPPRKVSMEHPQLSLPFRKVSAPELSKPTVTRGGRRNLFVERCISQEKKENLKTKSSTRKFSTPVLSTTNTDNINDNNNENDTKCAITQVKASETSEIKDQNSATKVASAKDKDTGHIANPPFPEISYISNPVPKTPVNSRRKLMNKGIGEGKENKENSQVNQITVPPRKVSAPEFKICQEGSLISQNGGRKLYTERCISVDEQQQLKAKPVTKKPRKNSIPNDTAENNQDIDQSTDKKLSITSSSSKTKLIEKCQLKPKSAQRKLSAPAKMITPPPPNPTINGSDLLSSGIILPSIREDDGKPSFANAAKIVHAKVQVASMKY